MKRTLHNLAILFIFLISSGCSNNQNSNALSTQAESQISTAVAKTVEALSYQPTVNYQEATRIAAALPSPTIAASSTPIPATKVPTVPPASGATSTYCDSFNFLGDVSIPDETVILPGSSFSKMWVVKNTGSCTWNSNYRVVFLSGDDLSAQETPIKGQIAPGQNAVLSVRLTAPFKINLNSGYTSFFKIKNPSGELFGWGPDANKAFWVKIKVGTKYLFSASPCNAIWRNENNGLYCPSRENDPAGYFLQSYSYTKENNIVEKRQSIIMAPQQIENGAIFARFEAVNVPKNAFFKTDTGCTKGMTLCKARVGLLYSIDGGPDQLLDEWSETYDGFVTPIEFELRDYGLDGKQVAFTFYVKSDGGPEDKIFWVEPRIEE